MATVGVPPPPPPPELLVEELPPQPTRDNIPDTRMRQVREEETGIRTKTSLGNTFMRKLSDEAGCIGPTIHVEPAKSAAKLHIQMQKGKLRQNSVVPSGCIFTLVQKLSISLTAGKSNLDYSFKNKGLGLQGMLF